MVSKLVLYPKIHEKILRYSSSREFTISSPYNDCRLPTSGFSEAQLSLMATLQDKLYSISTDAYDEVYSSM